MAKIKRLLLWGGLGATALFATIGGGWILSLPPAPAARAMPPIPAEEAQATLAALKPKKRVRPVIAIVGINDGTETTDYLMPYGILKRAGIGEIVALATKPGPIKLFPALKVLPQATVAEFDARHPDGADYVLVPRMLHHDDPGVIAWIKSQAAKGALIIGVCAGARVVANAGLLDGRRATTHWYYLDGMLDRHPTIRYVPDRRLVVDGNVATTTGITASLTMSLTLIEAIAGRAKAEETARDLGVTQWDARHDSGAFRFTRPFALTALGNTITFWNHEDLGVELVPGLDEVSLALVTDAWSRTYRSRAVTFAATSGAQTTRNGLSIIPDQVGTRWPAARQLPMITDRPAAALRKALDAIAGRHGEHTARFVAMQLEYPKPGFGLGDGVEF